VLSDPPPRVTRARAGLSSMCLRSVRLPRFPSTPPLGLQLVVSAWSWKVRVCSCLPGLEIWCGVGWKEGGVTGQRVRWRRQHRSWLQIAFPPNLQKQTQKDRGKTKTIQYQRF